MRAAVLLLLMTVLVGFAPAAAASHACCTVSGEAEIEVGEPARATVILAAEGDNTGCPCCPADDDCTDCTQCRAASPSAVVPPTGTASSVSGADALASGAAFGAMHVLACEGPPPRSSRF